MQQKSLRLWGEEMPIKSSREFLTSGNCFTFQEVQASDDTHGLLEVCTFTSEAPVKNLEADILLRLQQLGLQPDCRTIDAHRFLSAIEPIATQLRKVLGDEHMGIVILVNGHEPGDGTLPLDQMTMNTGDTVQIYYRITTAVEKRMNELLHIRSDSDDCEKTYLDRT